jgi:hypothetical protein
LHGVRTLLSLYFSFRICFLPTGRSAAWKSASFFQVSWIELCTPGIGVSLSALSSDRSELVEVKSPVLESC